MATALPRSVRLPIPIVSRAPTDADHPTTMPIVLPAILILIVVPVIAISVVMASVGIRIIPSVVTISRSRRRNKTGDSDHHSKQ
jgi:hypothetical protein